MRRRRRGGRSRRSEGGRQQLSAISRAETREERLKEEQRTQDAFDEALLKLQELDRLLDTSTTKEPLQNDETLLSEWTEVATFLIDTYRTTKALYPSDGVSSRMEDGRKAFLANAEDPSAEEAVYRNIQAKDTQEERS